MNKHTCRVFTWLPLMIVVLVTIKTVSCIPVFSGWVYRLESRAILKDASPSILQDESPSIDMHYFPYLWLNNRKCIKQFWYKPLSYSKRLVFLFRSISHWHHENLIPRHNEVQPDNSKHNGVKEEVPWNESYHYFSLTSTWGLPFLLFSRQLFFRESLSFQDNQGNKKVTSVKTWSCRRRNHRRGLSHDFGLKSFIQHLKILFRGDSFHDPDDDSQQKL